ncbi:MAG: sugar ABC transporter ATP-binding protein [Chloroflexi bacterium]|nr:MAG: sugar ABC transporter ATP-binding protein [Chloroflexota bacterium]
MSRVEYADVSKRFPTQDRAAVDRLTLDVADGEFLVLLGPSGCGKTTALRMLAGLEHPDRGDILIDGASVIRLEPKDRDVALVFQSYALYPHMSVRDNIQYPLRVRQLSAAERGRKVERVAELLGIVNLLPRRPAQLSGGEQQRVALARAIVREPRVFLMDEPLSNLDAKLRTHTRTELKALQQQLGVTTIFVTHDQAEAMTMSDRIAVLERASRWRVARAHRRLAPRRAARGRRRRRPQGRAAA